MCYARRPEIGPLSQLNNMEIWSGKRESASRIVMTPDFEVVGCHNQNHIMIFMKPGKYHI